MQAALAGARDPLCCDRAYDRGELDLLPYLERRYRAELAHLSLLSLVRLVTGTRWRPVDADIANTEQRE